MSETEQFDQTDQTDGTEQAEQTDGTEQAEQAEQAEETRDARPAVDATAGAAAPSDDDEHDEHDESDEHEESDESDESDDGPGTVGDATSIEDRLEREGDIAADYLEELLDIADLDGDLDMDVEAERAVVSIVGADLQQLVGEGGQVLDALQELTRLAVNRETGERSRLMLDVSGHRATRRRELEELAATTVASVKESGERAALRPMTPFERKVVHDAVAAAGLSSESEGVEPRRYVVVLPA
jgi:spoIIIJ-associated protein